MYDSPMSHVHICHQFYAVESWDRMGWDGQCEHFTNYQSSMLTLTFSISSRHLCVINLHTDVFVLPDGGYVAKIIRLLVEGKSPPFPDKADTTAATGRVPHTAAAHEQTFAKQSLLLAFCAGGLLTFYLIWGLLQERIMAFNYSETEGTSERFTNSQFLVFMNRIFALVVAVVVIVMRRRHSAHQPPLYKYSYSSLSNIISSWCQYEALKFVSFPVQVSVLGTAVTVQCL